MKITNDLNIEYHFLFLGLAFSRKYIGESPIPFFKVPLRGIQDILFLLAVKYLFAECYVTNQIFLKVKYKEKGITPSYLSFPIYVLLDLEMLSASIDIMYSVQVVRRVLFAERRNLPFSTSKAAKWEQEHENQQ